MAGGKNAASASGLKRVRFMLWIAVALAAAIALIVFSADGAKQKAQEQADTAALGAFIGGPFTLTDGRTGKAFTDKDLLGKPFVVFFGFTRCPDVCPTSLQRMARLRKAMNAAKPGSGDAFEIVFVSVDPESDSPKGVADYVALFGTPIIPLTGTQAQIDAVRKAYRLYVKRVATEGSGDGYTIDHTATLYLVGKNGKVVSTIAYEEQDKVAQEKLQRLIAL